MQVEVISSLSSDGDRVVEERTAGHGESGRAALHMQTRYLNIDCGNG